MGLPAAGIFAFLVRLAVVVVYAAASASSAPATAFFFVFETLAVRVRFLGATTSSAAYSVSSLAALGGLPRLFLTGGASASLAALSSFLVAKVRYGKLAMTRLVG